MTNDKSGIRQRVVLEVKNWKVRVTEFWRLVTTTKTSIQSGLANGRIVAGQALTTSKSVAVFKHGRQKSGRRARVDQSMIHRPVLRGAQERVLYTGPTPFYPLMCFFPWNDLDPIQYMVPCAHLSLPPLKRYLDRFICFCIARLCAWHGDTHTDHDTSDVCSRVHLCTACGRCGRIIKET